MEADKAAELWKQVGSCRDPKSSGDRGVGGEREGEPNVLRKQEGDWKKQRLRKGDTELERLKVTWMKKTKTERDRARFRLSQSATKIWMETK